MNRGEKRFIINFRDMLIVLLVLLGLFVIAYLISGSEEKTMINISYDSLLRYIDQDKVKEIIEKPPYLMVRLSQENSVISARVLMITNRLGEDKNLMAKIAASKESIVIKAQDADKGYPFVYVILSSLPMLLLAFSTFYTANKIFRDVSRNNVLGSLDKSNIKPKVENFNKITFKDVAGYEEVKEDLKEIVEFLKNPSKFFQLGAKIPRGVLLLGQPGTGKTLFAKAISGEANVPFIYMSGSDFVEMFVGRGAFKVRELFREARQKAPCIIFIDEIDAVAKQRSNISFGGSNEEREQTLNQLLIEMDGFESSSNIIVIAATNRPDVLDKAITRAGRFDRQVVVDRPSLEEREAILRVHARNKPLDLEVDLKRLARKTAGFVGADLEGLLNEAAILAARYNRKAIKNYDIEEALERVIAGTKRKSKIISDKEKRIVAYHEAGHALIAYLLPNTDPIHKISIIPRGYGNLGYTLQLPDEDKFLVSKEDLLKRMKILMGGRVAEELIFGEITSGSSDDIEKATSIAKNMIVKYGMSDVFGPRTLGKEEGNYITGKENNYVQDYSNETALKIDKEVSNAINDAYLSTKELLRNNLDKLELLTRELLVKEVLYEQEVLDLLKNNTSN